MQVAGEAPIIPISAQLKYNIDIVAQHIATKIPVRCSPDRDFVDTLPHEHDSFVTVVFIADSFARLYVPTPNDSYSLI
jgi:hypothetical protein